MSAYDAVDGSPPSPRGMIAGFEVEEHHDEQRHGTHAIRRDACRPGSGSSRSKTPAVARRGSAVSPRPAIATCNSCSWSERWRSSAMPSGTGPGGHGSCSGWHGQRPRWRRLRSPTRRPDGLGADDRRRALQGAVHRINREKVSDRRRGWKGRTGADAKTD